MEAVGGKQVRAAAVGGCWISYLPRVEAPAWQRTQSPTLPTLKLVLILPQLPLLCTNAHVHAILVPMSSPYRSLVVPHRTISMPYRCHACAVTAQANWNAMWIMHCSGQRHKFRHRCTRQPLGLHPICPCPAITQTTGDCKTSKAGLGWPRERSTCEESNVPPKPKKNRTPAPATRGLGGPGLRCNPRHPRRTRTCRTAAILQNTPNAGHRKGGQAISEGSVDRSGMPFLLLFVLFVLFFVQYSFFFLVFFS